MDDQTVVCDLSRAVAPVLKEQEFEASPVALVVMDFANRRRMRINGFATSGTTSSAAGDATTGAADDAATGAADTGVVSAASGTGRNVAGTARNVVNGEEFPHRKWLLVKTAEFMRIVLNTFNGENQSMIRCQ